MKEQEIFLLLFFIVYLLFLTNIYQLKTAVYFVGNSLDCSDYQFIFAILSGQGVCFSSRRYFCGQNVPWVKKNTF